MRAKDIEAENRRTELQRVQGLISEQEAPRRRAREPGRERAPERRAHESELAEQSGRARGVAEQIERQRGRIAQIDARKKELDEAAESAKNVVEGRRMRIDNRERELAELSDELTKRVVELGGADSRINMLEEMERDYEGFGGAVKAVMRSARRGELRGVHGTVSELLRTSEETALAIETALGAAIQNVVVDTQSDGKRAIEMLQRRNAGARPSCPSTPYAAGGWTEYPARRRAASASRWIWSSSTGSIKNVFENLLGRTLVAETLSDAIAISRRSGRQAAHCDARRAGHERGRLHDRRQRREERGHPLAPLGA